MGLAQLVRAPGCGPGGRGFESHISPHKERELFEVLFLFFSFVLKKITGLYSGVHFVKEGLTDSHPAAERVNRPTDLTCCREHRTGANEKLFINGMANFLKIVNIAKKASGLSNTAKKPPAG